MGLLNFDINDEKFLAEYTNLFFDFDGVIKDSVEIKSKAFMNLFYPFGEDIVIKVKNHHEENGGMSRYEKLPLYLNWAGQTLSDKLVNEYCLRFSNSVIQNVVDSEWVPGVLDFLNKNYKKNTFFLVTSTPKFEIDQILESLEINNFFKEVFGSPMDKNVAIESALKKYSILPSSSAMIGDSNHDHKAAKYNGVLFLLRKTSFNKDLQDQLPEFSFEDFINE